MNFDVKKLEMDLAKAVLPVLMGWIKEQCVANVAAAPLLGVVPGLLDVVQPALMKEVELLLGK